MSEQNTINARAEMISRWIYETADANDEDLARILLVLLGATYQGSAAMESLIAHLSVFASRMLLTLKNDG